MAVEEGESFFFNVCVQFTITVSLKKGLEMEEEENHMYRARNIISHTQQQPPVNLLSLFFS